MSLFRQPVFVGLSCALLAFLWQFFTVRFNFGGDWTALYYTGSAHREKAPPIVAEGVYEHRNSDGWDGQWYHAMAHDPFLTRGTAPYIDAARLRYRRILLPAAAHALAFGSDSLVDPAYRLVILLCFALGGWGIARIAQEGGKHHPAVGLLFAILPASIASVDRLAVDAGLAAMVALFALLAGPGGGWRMFALLAAAGLIRETGLLLTASYCAWLLWEHRDWKKAAWFATAALPAFAWYAYIAGRTTPVQGPGDLALPFAGVLHRFLHPAPYPFAWPVTLTIRTGDYLAAFGVLLALLLAWRRLRTRGMSPLDVGILAYAVLGIVVWRPGDWLETLDYARILTPLLLLPVLDWLRSPRGGAGWLLACAGPLLLTLPRFAIGAGSQALGIARGLFGL